MTSLDTQLGSEHRPSPEALYEAAVPRPVSEFKSNYGGGYVHDYPGERPETSFLVDAENILAADEAMVYPMRGEVDDKGRLTVEVKWGGERVDLDDVLVSIGQPTMSERVPIVAYGANVCPKAMASKFHLDKDKATGVVPTLYASMPGYEVVWHEKPGQKGNGIAVLYKGEETPAADVEVAVNFLTPEQLLLLHRSEKNYDLGYVGSVTVDGGHEIPALIYAGNDSIVLKDDHPVAVSGVRRKTSVLEEMPSTGIVEYMLDAPGVREELAVIDPRFADANADTYAQIFSTFDVVQKKEIQAIVKERNEKTPVSMADPVYSGLEVVSWANPNTIPTYGELTGSDRKAQKPILLPEQILRHATAEEKQQIRTGVSQHFRDIVRPKL